MKIPFAAAGLAVLFFALALGGCSDGGNVTVTIDKDCKLTDESGALIDKLTIYAGREVEWVNKHTGVAKVVIDDTTVFGTGVLTLNAGETKTTMVECGSGNEATLNISCDGGPSTGPRVVVEDPP